LKKYKIIRRYEDQARPDHVVRTGLTRTEALDHIMSPESSYYACTNVTGLRRTHIFGPWWDEFQEE